jgi:hypothetical protein
MGILIRIRLMRSRFDTTCVLMPCSVCVGQVDAIPVPLLWKVKREYEFGFSSEEYKIKLSVSRLMSIKRRGCSSAEPMK